MSTSKPVVPVVGMARLIVPEQAYWSLSLYPQAGEAGGGFVAAGRRHSSGIKGQAVDPERAKAETARRARGRLRRYCAANGLNRLGTLTYRGEGCHDPAQLREDVATFFRSLRTGLGGDPLAYVWVPEWHPKGHGLHLHFAVGRYVKRSLIDKAWGHGFIHIKSLSDLGHGATARDEARMAALYLSKYVSKTFDTDLPTGLHRYGVGQGFQPLKHQIRGHRPGDLLAQAQVVMGANPVVAWSSKDAIGWQGPPAVWFSWA